MSGISDRDPVIVVCGLCDERMPARRDRTHYVASNHALDWHRDQLLADRERTLSAFTVTSCPKTPSHL